MISALEVGALWGPGRIFFGLDRLRPTLFGKANKLDEGFCDFDLVTIRGLNLKVQLYRRG
jgi:hypothetical protein